jgi:hypothetical protein
MSQGPEQYPDQEPPRPEERERNGWVWAVGVLVVLAVLAALGWFFFLRGDDGGSAAPSPSPSATTSSPTASTSPSGSPSASPSETPDLAGFATDDVTEGGFPELGDQIGVGNAVRVGHHEGYDRITWQFSEPGSPSYEVKYVDEPRSQGSGDPVQVAGDAYLSVTITSVGVPEPGSPEPTLPAADLTPTVFAQVGDIWGGFEGYGETFVGVKGEKRPFKVTVLQNPTRLVVDVANG